MFEQGKYWKLLHGDVETLTKKSCGKRRKVFMFEEKLEITRLEVTHVSVFSVMIRLRPTVLVSISKYKFTP